MNPLFLLAAAAGGIVLVSRRKTASASGSEPLQDRLCVTPPGPQPNFPVGWHPMRSKPSATALAQAKSALGSPLGTFKTFTDEDGETRAVIVSWHCHELEEGVKPTGWHKGANLLEHEAGMTGFDPRTHGPGVAGILDHDTTASILTGPGYFRTLSYIDGRGWIWGQYFQSSTLGKAMGSMRLSYPSAWRREYLYRWVPAERRWGRVA